MFAQTCFSPSQKELPQKHSLLNLTFERERERERDDDVDTRRIRGVGVGGSSKDGLGLINKSRGWLATWHLLSLSLTSFFCLFVCFEGYPSWVCLLWNQSDATCCVGGVCLRVRAGGVTVRETDERQTENLSGLPKIPGAFSRIVKDTGFISAPSKAKRPFGTPCTSLPPKTGI